MPVVQTPIPGDQLANMNEQMRAVAGALPAAPVIPPEMLQQAGAVTPEQELARLTSIMNAPFQSEMPVVSMARGQSEMPVVSMARGGFPTVGPLAGADLYGASPYASGLGATGYVGMNTGGMIQDAMRLQSAGSGDHSRLVHMTQDEVNAMNALAASGIGGLRANGMAINPETGLPEAGIFKDLLPALVGLGLTFASGGALSPWLIGGAAGLTSMATTGGDLGRSILAGLGAGFGASLAQAGAGAAASEAANLSTGGLTAANAPQLVESGISTLPAQTLQSAPYLSGVPQAASFGVFPGFDPSVVAQADLGRFLPTGGQQFSEAATQQFGRDVGASLFQASAQEAPAAGRELMAQGLGMWGTPAVPWSEVAMKLAPGAMSLADAGGLFDPPETDWGKDTGIGGYDYQGPYLPEPRTPVAPPEGFQPGIDPQFPYFSYANKGGYVGGLPTIRAQSGYEPYDMPRNQQQPQPQQPGSPVFNQLAMMGALGQPPAATPFGQALQRPQLKQPLPFYTSSIPQGKLPMLRRGQTAMAAHGGPVGNLVDPQYRWSDTPDPMMREQVYRRANGGLAGIDPQYRWFDTLDPTTREQVYRRARGGLAGIDPRSKGSLLGGIDPRAKGSLLGGRDPRSKGSLLGGIDPRASGGSTVMAPTGAATDLTVDRGPYQTLSLGEYTPPPADYQHGIDPQWNFYPGSTTNVVNPVSAEYSTSLPSNSLAGIDNSFAGIDNSLADIDRYMIPNLPTIKMQGEGTVGVLDDPYRAETPAPAASAAETAPPLSNGVMGQRMGDVEYRAELVEELSSNPLARLGLERIRIDTGGDYSKLIKHIMSNTETGEVRGDDPNDPIFGTNWRGMHNPATGVIRVNTTDRINKFGERAIEEGNYDLLREAQYEGGGDEVLAHEFGHTALKFLYDQGDADELKDIYGEDVVRVLDFLRYADTKGDVNPPSAWSKFVYQEDGTMYEETPESMRERANYPRVAMAILTQFDETISLTPYERKLANLVIKLNTVSAAQLEEGASTEYPAPLSSNSLAAINKYMSPPDVSYDVSPNMMFAKAKGGLAGIDPQYRWSDVPTPADREHLYRKALGGVAGEPEISKTGIMDVATPDMQGVVAERGMVVPAPDQPQNPVERVIFDRAVLALQGELEPEPAQAAITEFIDIFGPEAFRQLQALVGGERETGGLVQTVSGETTVGMTEEEAMAQQGPDVIPGKIVDPATGRQTANLLVGENEYIEPADSLSRRAMAAGMAGTPQNGAIVRSQEEEQLRRAYG